MSKSDDPCPQVARAIQRLVTPESDDDDPYSYSRGRLRATWACEGKPVLFETWCLKQSAWLRAWRPRWLVFTPTALHSFREKRGYASGARPTETFELHRMGRVRALDAPVQGALLVSAAERAVLLQFVLDPVRDAGGGAAALGVPVEMLRDAWATAVVNARCFVRTRKPAYAAHSTPMVHTFEEAPVRFEERYVLRQVIGRGASSVVHAAVCLQSGQRVAAKVVRKRSGSVREEERHKNEAALLRLVAHPHVVQLLNHFETPSASFFVLELLPGGDILEQLVRRFGKGGDGTRYAESDVREILWMALSALAHVHELRVVHRDIKPENVLLVHGAGTDLRIGDFGMARRLSPGDRCADVSGTRGYMAPEILGGVPYGAAVDVWALGVLLCILLSGTPPFDFADAQKEREQVLDGRWNRTHPNWAAVSPEAHALVGRFLQVDPDRRATAAELLRSPWVQRATGRWSDERRGGAAGKSLGGSLDELVRSRSISASMEARVKAPVPQPPPTPSTEMVVANKGSWCMPGAAARGASSSRRPPPPPPPPAASRRSRSRCPRSLPTSAAACRWPTAAARRSGGSE